MKGGGGADEGRRFVAPRAEISVLSPQSRRPRRTSRVLFIIAIRNLCVC